VKFFLATIVVLFFVTGCVSKSEKAKNTIPYKYRSPEQVLIACNNQMKRNTNNNASAGSNIGNVLLGVMMGIQEDWACDPLR
tara:strand:- start:352 stop:597 length:246 start_codon:yes stop_codon:yes gene_type:complete